MPTYEYKCDACGHEFEKFQSMSAEPIKKCPKCGKNKVRRLISGGAGLIFKGSGFYITDYREAGYSEKAKADSAEGQKPAESKPADAGGDSAKPAATDGKPADAKSTAKDGPPKSEPKPEKASRSAKKK